MKIAPLCFAVLLLWGCPGSESPGPNDGGSIGAGGFRAVVDPESGELTSDPTASTSSFELILREDSLSTSDGGLFEEELPDGTVMLDPQGRYKSALRVRVVGDVDAAADRGEK